MCARKFSQSSMGEWDVDATGMPVIHLNVPAHLSLTPLPAHTISTGRLGAAVDALGRITLIDQTADVAQPYRPLAGGHAGQFFFELTANHSTRPLLLSAVEPDETPAIEWGVGHAVYSARPNFDGRALSAAFKLIAPPRADFFLVELDLKNESETPLSIHVRAIGELPVMPAESVPPATFKRSSVVMFTEIDARGRDFFLASAPGWTVDAVACRLQAMRTVSLAAGEGYKHTLLFGIRRECTVEWASQQLRTCEWENIQKERVGPLELTFPRFPETWMREECVWAVSRLLAGSLTLPAPTKEPTADETVISTVRSLPGSKGSPQALRDLLRLSLPLSYINPELARNNLVHATTFLDEHGALAAVQPGSFRPEADVCDLEIWLILGWCHLLTLTGDDSGIDNLLTADGSQLSLQQVLEKAYSWIDSAIGTGAHGLVRSGSGDGLNLLAPMGRHGCGESTVATAQLIYALDLWSSLEPHLCERPTALFERARLQISALRRAVGDAYQNNVFVRGFDDEGDAVGDAASGGGWFTDAQAWAILAGGASSLQRERAAQRLNDAGKDLPLATVYPPYPPCGPSAVSATCPLSGCGENGGIDAFSWACAVWAMAEAHLREEALQQWSCFSLRHMMLHYDMAAFLPADAEGKCPSHLLPCGWHYPAFTGTCSLPDTAWLSWHHFALSKILS